MREKSNIFHALTGYDLDYFLHQIQYGEIEIKKKYTDKLKCRKCGLDYEIELEPITFHVEGPPEDPTNIFEHNSFHCVKCMNNIAVIRKIIRIEVILNEE